MMQEVVYNDVGYRYAGATIFLMVLQWVTALGRFGVRTFIVGRFGWDDAFVLITLIIATGEESIFLAMVYMTNGGVDDQYIPPHNLIPAINSVLALICIFVVGTACLKIACGLLLLRVLVKPWQVYTIYTAMFVTTLYSIYSFFFTLFECGNPAMFHLRIIEGECVSKVSLNATIYTHSILVALVDCLFAVLPIALIWSTDMSRRAKISVAAVLGLASLGCVCVFVRIGYVHDVIHISNQYFSQALPLALLSISELSLGVTCISICTYKPFFNRFLWHTRYYYYDEEGVRSGSRPRGAQRINDPFGSNASLEFQDMEQTSPSQRDVFADSYPTSPTKPTTAFADSYPTSPTKPATALSLTPPSATENWPLTDFKMPGVETGSPTSPITPVSPARHV